MDSSSFYKFNITTACCEDICGHICIQKSNNDHFHEFTIFVSKITSSSFLLFRINKLGLDFLHRQILSLVCPSERTTWRRFYPTGPKGTAQRPTKNMQSVLQHCSKTSWIAILRVLSHNHPRQTFLATNKVVNRIELGGKTRIIAFQTRFAFKQ